MYPRLCWSLEVTFSDCRGELLQEKKKKKKKLLLVNTWYGAQ